MTIIDNLLLSPQLCVNVCPGLDNFTPLTDYRTTQVLIESSLDHLVSLYCSRSLMAALCEFNE